MTSKLEVLRDFIRAETGYNGELDVDLDLMEAKVLDSFNIVVVATFIQERFEVELEAEDLVRTNLCKLSSMLNLVEKKRSAVLQQSLPALPDA